MARQSAKSDNTTEVKKQTCTCCGKEKDLSEFYMSTNILYKNFKKLSVCKECLIDTVYNFLFDECKDEVEALYELCRLTNSYFEEFLYNSAKTQAESKKGNSIQIYFQKINSLPQYRMKTFKDSAIYSKTLSGESQDTKIEMNNNDKKNEEDVLTMLGYDPFESENIEDRRYLFNRFVDYLDEDTQHDNFKLSSSIELVKTFNQLDKLNAGIAMLTTNPEKIAGSVGGIKSLIDAKKQLYSSALGLAKDNGISVNHNNNKSKGGNTLSGINKKLNEIGLDSAELNLFDIETSEAMKQIADISNKSILDQLILNENDYTDMVSQQKEMIRKLDEKNMKIEEELRLLKIKLKQYEDR